MRQGRTLEQLSLDNERLNAIALYRSFALLRMTRLRMVVILSAAKNLYESIILNVMIGYTVAGAAMRRSPFYILAHKVTLFFHPR